MNRHGHVPPVTCTNSNPLPGPMHATDLPVMALFFLFQFIRALSSSLGSQATQEGHRDHRAPFTSSRSAPADAPSPVHLVRPGFRRRLPSRPDPRVSIWPGVMAPLGTGLQASLACDPIYRL